MTKPLKLCSALLLSTALVSPAMAQPASPPSEAPAEEEVEISAPGGSPAGGDIVVVGRNIPNIVRAMPEVVSVLSSADIARTGEGDIAGALGRVTGLSVVGNGFVYVRGLGDRYSLALLNGSPLPSPEPLKRVVPLDIFPTNVVASSLVQKSYSVSYPGEFGGGVINLTTKAIPKEPFLDVSLSTGTNSEVFAAKGLTYKGGDLDWLGYNDGNRSAPANLIADLRAGNGTLASRDLATKLGYAASLTNAETTLLQRNAQLPFDFGLGINAGTALDWGDTRIGLIGSFGYSNKWKHRVARQQQSVDAQLAGLPNKDFQATLTENRIGLNGLLGIGAEIGRHTIRWTNLYIHDTSKQGQLRRGYSDAVNGAEPVANPDFDGTTPIVEQNTNWVERQLIDTQLVGEFDFGPVDIDLRAAYANSKRKAPYERTFLYRYDTIRGQYVNNLSGQNAAQYAEIAFGDLNENVYSGSGDVNYTLPTDRRIVVSAGAAYTKTDRHAERFILQYLPGRSLAGGPDEGRPDIIVSDYYVYNYNIQLIDATAGAGAAVYDAELEVKAGYGQLEAELFDGLTLVGGARYEDAEQVVTTGAAASSTRLANSYWLPAATLTWNFAEDMQLRIAGSKTIARPQFRELAPQLYFDYESNRGIVGNPLLTDSELWNVEARYEWYFDRDQRLSLAGFYKHIDRPIEAVTVLLASDVRTSYINAPEASLYGVEIEAQKYFPLENLGDAFASKRLVLVANYTYSKSEITADDTPVLRFGAAPVAARNVLADGSSLTGQSDHIANVQLGIEDTDRLMQLTFLFNYASERVTSRGLINTNPAQPNIFEDPGFTLDIVGRVEVNLFNLPVELKVEARNLTGTAYKEFQQAGASRIDFNRYETGSSFSIGATAKF